MQRPPASALHPDLDAILDAALDCVIAMDADGQIVTFNAAAERTFGFRAEDVIGRDMAEVIIPPQFRDAHRNGLERHLAGGPPTVLDRRIEIAGLHADGHEFPVELTVTRVPREGPPLFVGYLRDITDRKLAEAELKASRARIVQAGYTARRRIERDLHDGAQQRLVMLALQLRIARSQISDEHAAAEMLDEALDELDAATAELRELARGIHPAVLTEGGLGPALRALTARAAVPVALEAVPAERFPASAEVTAYFVVAEALTNVARHAQAPRAAVNIEHEGEWLIVEVRDDGRGGAAADGGSGLRGLQDRLSALGGRMTVVSPPGEGTTLRAEVPCGS